LEIKLTFISNIRTHLNDAFESSEVYGTRISNKPIRTQEPALRNNQLTDDSTQTLNIVDHFILTFIYMSTNGK